MGREITIHGTLVALSEDVGNYTVYVFENLDAVDEGNKYIMCTRLPNWNQADLVIGDTGYISFKEITAGLDKWYNERTQEMLDYRYSQVYFIKFVPEKRKKLQINNAQR